MAVGISDFILKFARFYCIMRRTFTYIVLALCVCINVCAQSVRSFRDEIQYTDELITLRPYNFTENWTVGVGGGVAVDMAENMGKAAVAAKLSSNFHLQLTHWFIPAVGMRFDIHMGKHKGTPNREMVAYMPNLSYYTFNMNTYSVEAMFNLCNILGRYREERRVDFNVFVGGGWLNSYNFDSMTDRWAKEYYPVTRSNKRCLMGRAGGNLSYRINDITDLVLEGAYTITADRFNGIDSDNGFDSYCDFRLGLTFHLPDGYRDFRFRYVTHRDAAYYSTKSKRVRRAYEDYYNEHIWR